MHSVTESKLRKTKILCCHSGRTAKTKLYMSTPGHQKYVSECLKDLTCVNILIFYET